MSSVRQSSHKFQFANLILANVDLQIKRLSLGLLSSYRFSLNKNENSESIIQGKIFIELSVCCHRLAPVYLFIFVVPLKKTIPQTNNAMGIVCNIIFVCHHDDRIPFVVQFLKQ